MSNQIKEFTKEEKHTPLIKILSWNIVKITVPDHPPQGQVHYITNITLYQGKNKIASKNFTWQEPAVFEAKVQSTTDLHATEHCNLHWTWNERSEMIIWT